MPSYDPINAPYARGNVNLLLPNISPALYYGASLRNENGFAYFLNSGLSNTKMGILKSSAGQLTIFNPRNNTATIGPTMIDTNRQGCLMTNMGYGKILACGGQSATCEMLTYSWSRD